jgi:hypothetical protein
VKFLLWFFDHLPFLACLAVGIAVGAHDRAELAVGLFVLGSLSEVMGAVSEIRADLRKSRCPNCHPLAEEAS